VAPVPTRAGRCGGTDGAAPHGLASFRHGVDVNTPQIDGMTALHWAAFKDDLQTS
jgi:ankyrin repeat protein